MTSRRPIPRHTHRGAAPLQAFVPHAGRTYAATRNYDRPDQGHPNVSRLSPYLRHRILTEAEVLEAVLGRHSATAAEKFVQEVYWRTYWKGWLEMRPGVWADYRRDLDGAWRGMDGDLAGPLARAEGGRNRDRAFDAWARELVTTGYLSNHARMWTASIWIFTLRLPWEVGPIGSCATCSTATRRPTRSAGVGWRGCRPAARLCGARLQHRAVYRWAVRSQGPSERDADALGRPRAAQPPRGPGRGEPASGARTGCC
jgi:hypothetical protein